VLAARVDEGEFHCHISNPTHGCGKASDVIPKQWAEKEAGKTIENLTQPELVPNQASKSNIVRGALMIDTTTQRKICPKP
jgi:hypothetical protein